MSYASNELQAARQHLLNAQDALLRADPYSTSDQQRAREVKNLIEDLDESLRQRTRRLKDIVRKIVRGYW